MTQSVQQNWSKWPKYVSWYFLSRLKLNVQSSLVLHHSIISDLHFSCGFCRPFSSFNVISFQFLHWKNCNYFFSLFTFLFFLFFLSFFLFFFLSFRSFFLSFVGGDNQFCIIMVCVWCQEVIDHLSPKGIGRDDGVERLLVINGRKFGIWQLIRKVTSSTILKVRVFETNSLGFKNFPFVKTQL